MCGGVRVARERLYYNFVTLHYGLMREEAAVPTVSPKLSRSAALDLLSRYMDSNRLCDTLGNSSNSGGAHLVIRAAVLLVLAEVARYRAAVAAPVLARPLRLLVLPRGGCGGGVCVVVCALHVSVCITTS